VAEWLTRRAAIRFGRDGRGSSPDISIEQFSSCRDLLSGGPWPSAGSECRSRGTRSPASVWGLGFRNLFLMGPSLCWGHLSLEGLFLSLGPLSGGSLSRVPLSLGPLSLGGLSLSGESGHSRDRRGTLTRVSLEVAVRGLGFGDWGLGFGVWGLGLGLGFRGLSSGAGVWGWRFGAWGLELRVWRLSPTGTNNTPSSSSLLLSRVE